MVKNLMPVFIAHRGYASAFPENTLIALDAARDAGAKFVEVDIQLTSDLIPVLFHDRNLLRLCQQPGAIHEYTFAQLEKFNVSDTEKFKDKYCDNKITSLESFIHYLHQYPELYVFVELKRSMIEHFGREQVLQVILSLFNGMKEQVSFISYDQPILKIINDTTKYTTGIVIDEWREFNLNAAWTPEWLFCSAEGLPENKEELNINSKIAVFEVGNVGLAKHLLAQGITYLETFRIKEMLAAFSNSKGNT